MLLRAVVFTCLFTCKFGDAAQEAGCQTIECLQNSLHKIQSEIGLIDSVQNEVSKKEKIKCVTEGEKQRMISRYEFGPIYVLPLTTTLVVFTCEYSSDSSEAIGYVVYYTANPEEPICNWKTKYVGNACDKAKILSTTIENLQPSLVYIFKVQAITQTSCAQFYQPQFVNMQKGVPVAPIAFEVKDVSENSVTISWMYFISSNFKKESGYGTYATEKFMSFVEPINEYDLYWKDIINNKTENYSIATSAALAETSWQKDEYTLKGLKPNTLYSIWIVTKNKVGQGSRSTPVNVITLSSNSVEEGEPLLLQPQDAKPDQKQSNDSNIPIPEEVKAKGFSTSEVEIWWKSMEWPKDVIGFRIYYILGRQPGWYYRDVPFENPCQINMRHTHNPRLIRVAVAARTEKIIGPISKIIRAEIYWMDGIYRAENVTSRSMILNIPNHSTAKLKLSYHGTKRYVDENFTIQEKIIPMKTVEIVNRTTFVDDLIPSTDYKVKISRISDDNSYEPGFTIRVSTLSETPLSIAKPEYAVQSGMVIITLPGVSEEFGPILNYDLIVVPGDNDVKAENINLELDVCDGDVHGNTPYVAARFSQYCNPRSFVLGDGKFYGGYVNRNLEVGKKYKVFVKANTESSFRISPMSDDIMLK